MYSVHVWYSTSKSGSSESMDEAARPPLDEPGAPGLGKAAMELGKLERTVDLQRCVRWSWRERERERERESLIEHSAAPYPLLMDERWSESRSSSSTSKSSYLLSSD